MPGCPIVHVATHRRPARSPLLPSLVLAAPASARIIEIGAVEPAIESTCPGTPCVAVSRTTGYQAQVVSRKRSFLVPADGRIVAWTIGLGDPNSDQMGYFDQRFGEASASLTVMRRNKFRSKRLIHRVVGPLARAAAGAVLRPEGPVPARHIDPGQEGVRRGPHGPDVGARR